jgi:hypothetical protein
VSDLYIPRLQIHERRERGCAVSFIGIHKSDLHCHVELNGKVEGNREECADYTVKIQIIVVDSSFFLNYIHDLCIFLCLARLGAQIVPVIDLPSKLNRVHGLSFKCWQSLLLILLGAKACY